MNTEQIREWVLQELRKQANLGGWLSFCTTNVVLISAVGVPLTPEQERAQQEEARRKELVRGLTADEIEVHLYVDDYDRFTMGEYVPMCVDYRILRDDGWGGTLRMGYRDVNRMWEGTRT